MSGNEQRQLDHRAIERALDPYGVAVDPAMADAMRKYIELLLAWNKKISLTAITSATDILRYHFGESLFALKAICMNSGRLADLGTGAGFPGLALKLANPALELTLIESNHKKCVFLQEVVRTLSLDHVSVLPQRMGDVNLSRPWDFVTARAVGNYEAILSWARNALAEQGRLAVWVGAEDAARIAGASRWVWHPPVALPHSQRRCILVGTPSPPSG